MEGFKVVDQADAPPGKCIASRDVEGPFIDTGNNITERGRVFISLRWLGEAAEEFLDMVPKAEVDKRFAALEAQLAEYAERMAELQEFYDSQERLTKAVERIAA